MERIKNKNSINTVWKAYLFLIAGLMLVAVSYYYWQLKQTSKALKTHMEQNLEIISLAIAMNADRALQSKEVMEEILENFMRGTAEFIAFLDDIEAFSSSELEAFAKNMGLKGIRIEREDSFAEGPEGWFPYKKITSCPDKNFIHLKEEKIYLASIDKKERELCISIGMEDREFEESNYKIGLETLVEGLKELKEVEYAYLLPNKEYNKTENNLKKEHPILILEDKKEKEIAKLNILLKEQKLVLGIKADPFYRRISHIQVEFWVFTGILMIFGGFFFWLLKGFHQDHNMQALSHEKELADEKELAALGRASAAITHEIRNPLNAISMGIQRLKLENLKLEEKDIDLLKAMGEAVKRTDSIVSELKRYTRPLKAKKIRSDVSFLLDSIIRLYSPLCKKEKIEIIEDISESCFLYIDRDFTQEIFENLIKNAIEAQKEGGWLHIKTFKDKLKLYISFENPGLDKSIKDLNKLLEPYFSTKVKGSGLGLAIVIRLLKAQEGFLRLSSEDGSILKATVCLPLNAKEKKIEES